MFRATAVGKQAEMDWDQHLGLRYGICLEASALKRLA